MQATYTSNPSESRKGTEWAKLWVPGCLVWFCKEPNPQIWKHLEVLRAISSRSLPAASWVRGMVRSSRLYFKGSGGSIKPSVPITLWSGSEKEYPLGICEWLWWHTLLTFKFLLTKDYIGRVVGEHLVGTHCWSQRHSKGSNCWVLFFLEQVLWSLANGWKNIWGMGNSSTRDSFSPQIEKIYGTPRNTCILSKQGMFLQTKSVRTEIRVHANGKWSWLVYSKAYFSSHF